MLFKINKGIDIIVFWAPVMELENEKKAFKLILSLILLTLSPLSTTKKLYANSLNPNKASHPDPTCLTLRQHNNQLWVTMKYFNCSRRKFQRRQFSGLMFKLHNIYFQAQILCKCDLMIDALAWFTNSGIQDQQSHSIMSLP